MRIVVRSFILLTVITLAAIGGAIAQPASMTGGITIKAAYIPGKESLLVTGTAPSGTVVFLSLSATFDSGVPTALVNRTNVVAARDGRYTAVLPYASAAEEFALLSVRASSWDGRSTATACCFPVPTAQTTSPPN